MINNNNNSIKPVGRYRGYQEMADDMEKWGDAFVIPTPNAPVTGTIINNTGINEDALHNSMKELKAPQLETSKTAEASGQIDPMAVANLGMDMMAGFSNTAGSKKESTMHTVKWAAQGAKAGAALGPVGAAVGGVIGLGAGVIDTFGDMNKRAKELREKTNKANDQRFTQTEMEAAAKKSEGDVAKLMQLRKNQLGYINPNFS